MPITKSAKKALRQTRKRAQINRRIKEVVKKAIRVFKKNPTLENLRKAYSTLDKAAKKNVFHKNKAARLKSRLSRLLKKQEITKEKRSSSKKTAKKTAQK